VGHASRSSGLLHLESGRARVSSSGLKTGGGAVWMVHVAPLQRSRGDEVEDGWVNQWTASNSSTPTLSFSLY
jgi:hypothetical protein